jgi:hypothetical protein
VLLLPALADVRAARLLADRDELVLAHDPVGLGPFEPGALTADPVGLAQDRLIRPVRLLGMAGRRSCEKSRTTAIGLPWRGGGPRRPQWLGRVARPRLTDSAAPLPRARGEAITCGSPAHTRRARSRASSRRGSGAGRPCA